MLKMEKVKTFGIVLGMLFLEILLEAIAFHDCDIKLMMKIF